MVDARSYGEKFKAKYLFVAGHRHASLQRLKLGECYQKSLSHDTVDGFVWNRDFQIVTMTLQKNLTFLYLAVELRSHYTGNGDQKLDFVSFNSSVIILLMKLIAAQLQKARPQPKISRLKMLYSCELLVR